MASNVSTVVADTNPTPMFGSYTHSAVLTLAETPDAHAMTTSLEELQ